MARRRCILPCRVCEQEAAREAAIDAAVRRVLKRCSGGPWLWQTYGADSPFKIARNEWFENQIRAEFRKVHP